MAMNTDEGCKQVNGIRRSTHRVRVVLGMALIALLSVALSPALFAEQPPRAKAHVKERVLVKFDPATTPVWIQSLIQSMGNEVEGVIPKLGVYVLKIPPGQLEKDHIDLLDSLPQVVFAEPDYIREPAQENPPAYAPNDPYYTNQWHLMKISMPIAWNTTTGISTVKIAVLDSGVDPNEEDLSGALLAGWNFYTNNSDTSDPHGHGTSVAGTIAAAGNNSKKVASVAWGCKILPVRISDVNGYATDSMIASGLTWAADQGAKVANISYDVSDSSTISNAAKYFQDQGGVVVVAAGNDGLLTTTPDSPYMLTVGATDSNDVLAGFSNRGDHIDVTAPGLSIMTTKLGANPDYFSGTSYSSPIVAGVVGLLLSVNSGLNPAQVEDILATTADDLGTAGWDQSYGWGRVNADRAVGRAMGFDTVPPTVSINTPTSGATVALTVSVGITATDDKGVAQVDVYVDDNFMVSLVSSPFTYSWNTTKTANGSRVLKAVARDAAGNTATITRNVTVKNTDGTRPTVKITSPSSRSTVSGVNTVYVTATDNYMVNYVVLKAGTLVIGTLYKAPYNFNWDTSKSLNGSVTLTATAYDGIGNNSSATCGVTVNNPDYIAPTISITSPTDGAKTTLSKLSIYHSATDNQKVTKVELYQDGVLKTSSTSSPFTISWSVLAGTHKLQSKAYDAAGNSAWSNIVYVTK